MIQNVCGFAAAAAAAAMLLLESEHELTVTFAGKIAFTSRCMKPPRPIDGYEKQRQTAVNQKSKQTRRSNAKDCLNCGSNRGTGKI